MHVKLIGREGALRSSSFDGHHFSMGVPSTENQVVPRIHSERISKYKYKYVLCTLPSCQLTVQKT